MDWFRDDAMRWRYAARCRTSGGRDVGGEGKGQSKVNQDCACVASALGGQPGTALLCVYDGHGHRGHDVSLECLFSVSPQAARSI